MRTLSKFLICLNLVSASPLMAEDLEILHWWTSGGEAKSMDVLKKMYREQTNSHLKESNIRGGGGANAMKALKTRAASGKPPAVVQMKGPQIQEWAQQNFLTDVDEVAKQEKWDQKVPARIASFVKYKEHWVGVPVNVHRVNWLWYNEKLLKKYGATPPKTVDELFALADKMKAGKDLPFAHGGQPWQDATVFETFFLAVAGPELHKRTFVDMDQSALKDPKIKQVFEAVRRYTTYLDENRKGLDWDKATKMVIEGRAAMQFMGDWAKGEFLNANAVAGKDFGCLTAPGTQGLFSFNVDSFVFFDSKSPKEKKDQGKFASIVLSDAFQTAFNKNKGSIPAIPEVNIDAFDACAKASRDDFVKASQTGGLLPSFSHQMALNVDMINALSEMISVYFHSEMSADDGVKKFQKVFRELTL